MENKKKFKLTPKEYNESLNLIDLDKILLIKSSLKVDRSNIDIGADIKMDVKDKVIIDEKTLKGKTVKIVQNYSLNCYIEKKRNSLFKIACDYEVELLQAKPLPLEFWNIYNSLSLRVNTWPYFREFVQNMTQRIGVPPLTLPLFKS